MSESKIRMKIGDHEFEAEGPVEVVNAQFEIFKELIKPAPDSKNKPPVEPPAVTTNTGVKVFSFKSPRVVVLNDPTQSIKDAMLLILFAQKQGRNNDAATGGEIKNGLEASGYDGQEISRRLRELCEEKLIASNGRHRAKRYHLTSEGLSKAEKLTREISETISQVEKERRTRSGD